VKRLESELGKLREADVSSLVDQIVGRAGVTAGVRLVVSREDRDADEIRQLAQRVVSKLDGRDGAAVVLGSDLGGKALVVAACSPSLVERGVTAPALLEPAAKKIGGGAGGKPILAFAGGPNAAALEEAVDENAIRNRLEELLAGN